MRVPLSWLNEYIHLNLKPHQIAKILTQAGLEVEGIETTPLKFEGVCVGKVLKVEKHPQADKLVVASVSDGQEVYQVVCGAPNCREGIKTAFAKIGARLEDGEGKEFKIKKSKLRGVESYGMLCAASELGIGCETNGIIEFAEQLKEGTDIASLYAETVFDISLTPNLSHCNSIVGIARELSALTGEPLKLPSIFDTASSAFKTPDIQVEIKDLKKCPRYCASLVQNIEMTASPEWMQSRLEACGLRPINYIVDITNYVLLELGHPLHAFDLDKIEKQTIVVREAQEGEVLKTLDGKERVLNAEDLLICDPIKPLAIAGVMGGANSEVTDETKNILIESAYFQPSTVRRTSKRLGLQTDASKRFERGTDPDQLIFSLQRANYLIQKIGKGDVCSPLIDKKEREFTPRVVKCRLQRVNQLLGTHLSLSEVEDIFKKLHFPYRIENQETFQVIVPTYRTDISEEVDLIEEVARLYGYDNIKQASAKYRASDLPHSSLFLLERAIRKRLIAEGLQEFLTCDLISPSSLDTLQKAGMQESAIVKVLNPTSIEQSILRTSLLPGLLQVVRYNADHQTKDVSGFEIGKIHFKQDEHYLEPSVFGIILTGKRNPQSWDHKSADVDFYDLKGMIENLLCDIVKSDISFPAKNLDIFHPGRQASIVVDSLEIGSLGEVHSEIQRVYDLPQRVYFAEVNLHDLQKVKKGDQRMEQIPVYPGSERDWTITLPEEIAIYDLMGAVHSINSHLIEEVSLVDIYRHPKLGENLKNVTLHFVYRDRAKTVSQETVDQEHARIIANVTHLIEELKRKSF